ncbi:hypothetical protein V4C55_33575 [Paraburkholderia sabiae]|uniref:Uncharacterized protein n=1 Tax=Paraburkholderia sabiae TaxID=273251 RepID=A0ABU9QME6_9BURK|nr:hypothetical protein [Paraburkholderia sabiae]
MDALIDCLSSIDEPA